MYSFLHQLLSDKEGGKIFTLFRFWHFFYIVLTIAVVVLVVYFFKNKDEEAKQSAQKTLISVAFGLYMADFFLMPFAYEEIDIDKLPFHACTSMSVLCYFSYHIRILEKYRSSFVLLGFISNLIYLAYPAGVMWYGIHPLSYRVIQTLLFHGVMTAYGATTFALDSDKFQFKAWRKDLLVLVLMTVWALIGNYAYSGTAGGYDHSFNWFFVMQDPLDLVPADIAPKIMPFVNIVVFFIAERLICWIITFIKNRRNVIKES